MTKNELIAKIHQFDRWEAVYGCRKMTHNAMAECLEKYGRRNMQDITEAELAEYIKEQTNEKD